MLVAIRRALERFWYGPWFPSEPDPRSPDQHEEPTVDEEEQARVLAEQAQRFYVMDDD